MRRIVIFTAAVLTFSLAGATDAAAQFRGRGGDRAGADGGREGQGGRGERGGDRSSRLEGFLRSMDTNGDGIIQESEVPPERERMFRYMAERAGIDTSQGVSISRIVEGMSARRGGPPPQADGGSTQASGSAGSTQSGASSAAPSKSAPDTEAPPLVRGFGVDSEPAAVPGFGTRIQPPSRVVLGGIVEPPAPEIAPRMLQYAQSMIARFDRNRSGALERDQWVQHWGDPGEIDANGDGKITAEELAAHLTRRRQSWGTGGPGGGGRGPDQQSGSREGDERSASDEERAREARAASQRPSYRFPAPHERLPDGLPDWFIERDVNMDGQVSMAEFANDWTDDKVEEFLRYDRNNDGIITVEEALNPLEHPPGTESDLGPPPAAGGQASPPESEQAPAEAGDEKPWWMQ